jgi:hypothetical protein
MPESGIMQHIGTAISLTEITKLEIEMNTTAQKIVFLVSGVTGYNRAKETERIYTWVRAYTEKQAIAMFIEHHAKKMTKKMTQIDACEDYSDQPFSLSV